MQSFRFYELSYTKCLLNVVPSVLWHCWLGVRKSIHPTKNIEPDAIYQQSVALLNTELAPTTSITGTSKTNVQHLFSFVPKLSMALVPSPWTMVSRTWDQGQGQGLCYQGQGQGQGHCSLSSRSLEDEAKSSRTHHWGRPTLSGEFYVFQESEQGAWDNLPFCL